MLICSKAYFKRNLRYMKTYTIYDLITFQKSMLFIPINCKKQEMTEKSKRTSSCTQEETEYGEKKESEKTQPKVSGKQPSAKGKTTIQRYDFSNVVS